MAEKRLVGSSALGELRLLGSGGTVALRNFQQIRQYLKASLGEEGAALLAEPAFDNARGRIDWYATLEEEPKPLTGLEPAAAEAARARLAAWREKVQGLAESLSRREQQSALLLGELLRQTLSQPNEDSVLVAGERLVLINWGAAADEKREKAVTAPLAGRLRAAPAPAAPPPEPAPPPAPPPARVQPLPPAVAPAPVRTAGYWLWALLLWLLFAGIMAGIYYYLLEACAVSGPGPEDNDNPFITFCPGQAVAETGPPPELQRERELAGELKQKLRQLEIDLVEARRECRRPQTPAPQP